MASSGEGVGLTQLARGEGFPREVQSALEANLGQGLH